MTYPITPPPELVQQWRHEWVYANPDLPSEPYHYIATAAARWGADQELEACCEWTQSYAECGDSLRAARRPKPLSEADQALEALDRIDQLPTAEDQRIIRRALERLKKMEGQGND